MIIVLLFDIGRKNIGKIGGFFSLSLLFYKWEGKI